MVDTPIYTIGGTVQAGSGRYIARRADEELLALCRAGAFAAILAARQMGKSSLMLRTAERLAAEGIRSVQIDLSLIGTQVDVASWYFGLLFEFRRQLRLQTNVLDWWQTYAELGPTQRFSLFCTEVLLREIAGPLVIFVDEIDTTLSLPFTDDFYAAIRGLYMERAQNPELARLSFVLIGVATPGDLVRDPKRTPFNIGQRVEMTDFSFEEALPLAEGLGLPEIEARQVLQWVLDWTSGHPYLTQRLCQAITERTLSPPPVDRTAALASQWKREPGEADLSESDIADLTQATFLDAPGEQDHNLQFVRDMLTKRAPDSEAVLTSYRAVRRARPAVPDEEQSIVKSHLKLSGVVRREQTVLRVRNRIYHTVFDERWIRDHLPVHWARRLRQALRLIAILLVLALSLGGLAIYALLQRQTAEAQAATALAAESTAVAAQATSEARRLEAEHQSQLALSRELAANAIAQAPADPELGLLLALEAEHVTHTDQAEAALREILLESAFHSLLRGHTGEVRSAVFSPDGKSIVTASTDGTARLWDTHFGTEMAVLHGHTGGVVSAAFGPDSKRVVTASDDGTARLWDSRSGAQLVVLRGHTGEVNSVAFSPDGKWVVTASADMTGRVWNTSTGTSLTVLRGHTGRVLHAVFSPDGARVVTASDDATARVWDANTGAQLALLDGHISVVRSAVFSPDGARVVTASYDGTARVWDASSGKQLVALLGHTDRVISAAFSPNGTQVVTASWDRTARLWDAVSGKQLAVLQSHSDVLTTATFSPDGAHVVTASRDSTARVWEVATGAQLTILQGHAGAVSSVAFSPDGTWIVTASADGMARLWEADAKQRITALQGHTDTVNNAVFSPDGSLIVTVGNDATVRTWAARSGRLIGLLRKNCVCAIHSVAFSPDGTTVVVANDDSTAEIWDVSSRTRHTLLQGHTDKLYDVAFSPDGTLLVTASADKTARVWEVSSGKTVAVLQGHTEAVFSAAFSPDGTQVVTASADGTVRLWEVRSGRALAVLAGHTGAVLSVHFSGNGMQLVTASDDGTAQVWDARTQRSVIVLRGHVGSVSSATFSPDDRLVITVGSDGTTRVWDVRSGTQMVVRTGRVGRLTSVAFSPDGTRVVTTGADRTARIYRWELFAPVNDLIARARAQVTRGLTCDEQQQYLHTTTCTTPTPGAVPTAQHTTPTIALPTP